MRASVSITIVLLGGTAYANPASIVPGGVDTDLPGVAQGRVDIIPSITYEYEMDNAAIEREQVGDPTTPPDAPLPVHRDLKFQQFRHTITPRLDIGVYHDTFVYAALPIVITQARELKLDSGVDRASSSTVVDGLLPMGGYDARDPNTPPGGDLMFRGVNRHGLDQVHLGLGVAPMNQMRDDTKPTWKLGAEVRLSVGEIMKFDPMAPDANHGVSTGVNELRLWTTFDRRLGWVEPWVELFWQVPLNAKSDSLFQNPGFGATNWQKGEQAGVAFGFEVYAVNDVANQNRISLDLGTRAVAHFEGRDYSEMWEVFALAGDSRGTPCTGQAMPAGCSPLILDADPTKNGLQPLSYPGISNIENYLETAARIALRAQIGPHVQFGVTSDLMWKTEHVITFADAGVDTNGDDIVNPGTAEVNPLHVQRIDLVGHRYHSANNFGFVIGVNGMVLF